MTTSKRSLDFAIAFSVFALLSACTFTGGTMESSPEGISSSTSDSESPVDDLKPIVTTPNVRYAGTLQKKTQSSSSEGTHILSLVDGQIILLESTDDNLSLSKYEDKKVEVRGSAQPTLDSSGTLMRVTEVIILEEGGSDASETDTTSSASVSSDQGKMCGGIAGIACDEGQVCVDDTTDSCDPKSGGADCAGVCVSTVASSSATSKVAPIIRTSSSVASSALSPSSETSSSQDEEDAASMEVQVAAMARQSFSEATSWTQKYCTGHIGFCVSVHKNWYFKSFGATTSNAWHVEFGLNSIDELGQGAIILNLVSGTASSMQASSGQIKSIGSDVIGFLDWTDGRHFEIIADQRLRAAVEYMLQSVTAYEPTS